MRHLLQHVPADPEAAVRGEGRAAQGVTLDELDVFGERQGVRGGVWGVGGEGGGARPACKPKKRW